MFTANKSSKRGHYFLCYQPGCIPQTTKLLKVSNVTARKSTVLQVITQLQIEGVPLEATQVELSTKYLDLVRIANNAMIHNVHPTRVAEFFNCQLSGEHFWFN